MVSDCDMLVGSCACGSTHTLTELQEYCENNNIIGPNVDEHPEERMNDECYCLGCLSYCDG